MRLSSLAAPALLLPALLAACEDGGDPVLTIDATGGVAGVAFLDRNADGRATAGLDSLLAGVKVSAVRPGGGAPVASATSDAKGVYRITGLPVGSYRVVVDDASLGDTVQVVKIDTADVTVAAADTPVVTLTLGFRVWSTAAAAALASGRRVTIAGKALSGVATFGDSTVHVGDASGALRAVGVRTGVGLGDSVRILGTVGTHLGRPALLNPTVLATQPSELPAAAVVSTAEAAAPAARLQASQVRVGGATVTDVASLPGGDVLVTLDDGSGPLGVVLDVNTPIALPTPVVRGAVLEVTGVLVPAAAGDPRWRLKPRRTADVAVSYPPVSTTDARQRPVGQLIAVEGIALNDLAIFGDLTLHVADRVGAIRVFAARSQFVFAGDSVRVLGIVTIRNGQPTLTDATATVLGKKSVPAPYAVSTGGAEAAQGGGLDAWLVRVTGATVHDTATVGGERVLLASDGTGTVAILIDRDTGIESASWRPGMRLDATGVLVPSAGQQRSWFLKPRTAADLVAR